MDTKVELKKKMVEVVANEVDVSTFGIRITQGSSPAGAEPWASVPATLRRRSHRRF